MEESSMKAAAVDDDDDQPGIFGPLRNVLQGRDYYMHLADLKSYLEADQKLTLLYADGDAWARKAVLNVAGCGKFSSDHTIAQYAAEIWFMRMCVSGTSLVAGRPFRA